MHVGTIDQTTTSFPTTRPDGSDLVNGDFLKVKPDAEVPFTVEGLTFNSVKDQATWLQDHWDLNANPYQNTYETPIKNKETESLSGTAERQNQVNEEFIKAFPMPYEFLEPVGDIDSTYLAYASFVDLDYAFAKKYYDEITSNPFGGACSSIVKDGTLARNYD